MHCHLKYLQQLQHGKTIPKITFNKPKLVYSCIVGHVLFSLFPQDIFQMNSSPLCPLLVGTVKEEDRLSFAFNKQAYNKPNALGLWCLEVLTALVIHHLLFPTVISLQHTLCGLEQSLCFLFFSHVTNLTHLLSLVPSPGKVRKDIRLSPAAFPSRHLINELQSTHITQWERK